MRSHVRWCEPAARTRQAAVVTVKAEGRRPEVRLNDGSRLEADRYVFACGPWLGQLFPDVIGGRIRSTRQEVFYFGAPAGDERFLDSRLPVWIDISDRFIYGIPGNGHRGFKVADDARGPSSIRPAAAACHLTTVRARFTRS